MASTEIEEIISLANDHKSFVLNGGAGSGKTYALIKTLNGIYAENPRARVACITFTNVAVNEIKERAPFEDLYVSTIHEFLWMTVSRYQKDLRHSLAMLIEAGDIKVDGFGVFTESYYKDLNKRIEYREWTDYSRGIISHDDLIKIVCYMFENNERLAMVLADSYDYIFIDEYQDTFSEVVTIPLKKVAMLHRKCSIGLFGDPMQSIYDRSSPEDVDSLVDINILQRAITLYNRRNPSSVLKLINQLRLDYIEQEAPDDENAPNYNKEGNVLFIYSKNKNYRLVDIRNSQEIPDGFFKVPPKDIKELFLVKRFIAEEAGFAGLFDVYADDRIVKFTNSLLPALITRSGILLDGGESLKDVLAITGYVLPYDLNEYSEQNGKLLDYALKCKYADIKRARLDSDLFMSAKKMSKYDVRDRGQRCDDLIQHIIGLQEILRLYEDHKYNDFIRKTNYTINSVADKVLLRDNMNSLMNMENKSIGDVIAYADKTDIWRVTDKVRQFADKNAYRYHRVINVSYDEIINLYNYTENNTPFSTQHGIKGAEFKNVFVILDNGGWRNYNFESLFEKPDEKNSVVIRSRKMFYVCCSRTLDNLIVYYQNPTEKVISQAKKWFGNNKVKEI